MRGQGSRLLLAFVLAVPVVAAAGDPAGAIPVLWQAPSCDVGKLGTVAIAVGRKVDESTQETTIPSADYRKAFARLAEAADGKGGNAVVLRGHEATYFTRSHRRSPEPVHIELRGAVIRFDAADGDCRMAVIDPQDVRRRARSGEPVEVASGEA